MTVCITVDGTTWQDHFLQHLVCPNESCNLPRQNPKRPRLGNLEAAATWPRDESNRHAVSTDSEAQWAVRTLNVTVAGFS